MKRLFTRSDMTLGEFLKRYGVDDDEEAGAHDVDAADIAPVFTEPTREGHHTEHDTGGGHGHCGAGQGHCGTAGMLTDIFGRFRADIERLAGNISNIEKAMDEMEAEE